MPLLKRGSRAQHKAGGCFCLICPHAPPTSCHCQAGLSTELDLGRCWAPLWAMLPATVRLANRTAACQLLATMPRETATGLPDLPPATVCCVALGRTHVPTRTLSSSSRAQVRAASRLPGHTQQALPRLQNACPIHMALWPMTSRLLWASLCETRSPVLRREGRGRASSLVSGDPTGTTPLSALGIIILHTDDSSRVTHVLPGKQTPSLWDFLIA